jgi:hypothetical protein
MNPTTRRLLLPLAFALAGAPAQAQQADHSSHACVRDIHKFVVFREPDSIRVTNVTTGKAEVIDYMDKRLVAVQFTVTVSSKNAQGGYGHPRDYQCWTSEDRQRVLEYKPRRD